MHPLLLVFLVLVFPVWDRYETLRLKRDATEAARIRAYRFTIAWQFCAALLLMASTPWRQISSPLRSIPIPRSIILSLVVGLMMALLLPLVMPQRNARPLQAIDYLLPRSTHDRLWFAAAAISAGVCEEIIFRGFLIRYLNDLFARPSIGWAMVAAALIFGLDHTYQGWVGALAATGLALVMTFLFFATSTLLVPMIVHALIDLRPLVIVRQSGR